MGIKTVNCVDLCIVHIHIMRENTKQNYFYPPFRFRLLKRTSSPSFKFLKNYYHCTDTILFYIEQKIKKIHTFTCR